MVKSQISKTRTKLFFCIIMTVILIGLLSGCKKQPEIEKAGITQEDKIQIGFCFDSFLIERWERDRDIFVTTAKELGAEVNVQNANGDVNQQIAQIEYLTSIRMEKAKELLSGSSLSMKEICAQVGYADPNYFSRTFKKNVGLTPTEYKESQNG